MRDLYHPHYSPCLHCGCVAGERDEEDVKPTPSATPPPGGAMPGAALGSQGSADSALAAGSLSLSSPGDTAGTPWGWGVSRGG